MRQNHASRYQRLVGWSHIGPEVRFFYSVDGNTCLLAGAEQEGPAHNPWSTQGPHPVVVETPRARATQHSALTRRL